jgi:multiple sugar transport system substrate-binding protein
VSKVVLKGMTWSHPRGYDPLVACSKLWLEKTGVSVEWDKRSLQDFESYPVEDLARAYDMIIIDHPHVGQITEEKCLLPLDVEGREAEFKALADGSVGASFPSYFWRGRQWAFPVDTATQVQAFRPDLVATAPKTWAEMLDLARQGRVLLPLRPPHSLMSFFSLAANLDTPCYTTGPGDLIDAKAGAAVFEMLREVASLQDPKAFGMDPIAAYEAMAEAGSPIACVPMAYGYVSYSLAGFRPRRVKFADIPVAGKDGPKGTTLGGTGMAVSAFSKSPKEALDFTYWIASGDVQKGPYAASGGQPGHADAWEDDAVNAATADFYRGTRQTLDTAWVRPRHDGYMAFQQAGSDRINSGLIGKESADVVVADLNRLFRESFKLK